MHLSTCLGVMRVQENLKKKKKKTKWSSSGESGYPKTETLTYKCVLDLQICVQDSSFSNK